MSKEIGNNQNQEPTEAQDMAALREQLTEGGFGAKDVDASGEQVDQTPDDAVVEGFLAQFNAEGDTALKAHDWKVYLPSRMCLPDFWGPLFGIIREESESVYVFDSKQFEKPEYFIGYIDNGSYASASCFQSFEYPGMWVRGVFSEEQLVLHIVVNENISNAIRTLRTSLFQNAMEELHASYSEKIPQQPRPKEMHQFAPVEPTYNPPIRSEEMGNTDANQDILYPVRIKTYDTVTNLFSRNTGLLESSIMLDKRAVLVGCGSVGSFVAMELARSGVGKFVLCDTDTLEIHNICRHQCGFSDLGRYKVDAVKDKILNINPNAEIITYRSMIQRVPEDELLPLLGRDTIIIGGGDNRASADWACKLATRTDSTFVATCCWTRAFAGEVFYWASGRNLSCYSCALGGLVDSDRPESHATYFGSDDEKEQLAFEPGVAVDIDFVTIIAVKLALDLLNRDNPDYTPRVINDLRQYTWICNTNSPRIGGERAGIFSYPLQITRNLGVHKDENCPFCGNK